MTQSAIDFSKITNIVFAGIDMKDCPDFTDAYIESAHYEGEPMSEEQLDEVNEDRCFIHDKVWNYLF